jgi:hypothetical protein
LWRWMAVDAELGFSVAEPVALSTGLPLAT